MTILAKLSHWPPGQTQPNVPTNNIFTVTQFTTENLTTLHVNGFAVLNISSTDRALVLSRGSYYLLLLLGGL